MGHLMSETQELQKTKHNTIQVIKRDGQTAVVFSSEKIHHALKKAFLSTIAQGSMLSQAMIESIKKITEQVTLELQASSSTAKVEQIQDLLEKKLMEHGFHLVAKNFILYRQKQAQRRQTEQTEKSTREVVLKIDESTMVTLTEQDLIDLIKDYSKDLKDINPELIVKEVFKGTYYQMSQKDFNQVLIMATRTLIETDPAYSYIASALLQTSLVQEAASYLQVNTNQEDFYRQAFIAGIKKGCENDILF